MSAACSRGYLAAVLLTGLLAVSQPTIRAAEAKSAKDSSLAQIPADAAFYTSTLRIKEQVELFYTSRAYKAIRALPSVKMAYDQVREQLKQNLGGGFDVEGFLNSDLGKEISGLLTEAASDEIFIFGGKQWGEFFRTFSLVSQAQTSGTYAALLAGGDPNTGQMRAILRALRQNKAQLRIPGLVIGFKLATPDKATKLLKKGSTILEGLAAGVKEIQDRFKVKKIGGGEFMVVELDGSLIPWQEAENALKDIEEKKEEFKELLDHLKKMKLSAALGISGNYLLLSIGETTSDLEAFLGKGKKLIDHEAIKPIRDVGDKRFTSLGYLSKEFIETAGGSYASTYSETFKSIQEAVKKADLKEERKKQILTTLNDLVKDLDKAAKIEYGPSVGYAYLTNSGYEVYAHDLTKNPSYDKIKFAMHEHWGGTPIFATSFGCYIPNADTYQAFVKYLKKGYEIAEGLIGDNFDANTVDEYKKVLQKIQPILAKLDKCISDTFIPAMQQSGLGIVIDGKWKSKNWTTFGMATEKEMPMIELGLLIGVSDAKKFDQGWKEAREILNELLEKLSDVPNLGVPLGLSLGAPSSGDGLYWWEIPTSPLDPQVVPTAGTGKAASVFTLSKKHAARLIKSTPLSFRTKELAFSGPVLGACVLDWVGFVELVAPWIETGVEQTIKELLVEEKFAKRWKKETQVGLQILKCFKGATCTTTKAETGVVHKTVVVVRDLEIDPEPID
ncbi:MAG: hypothetical protein SNJ75_11645 [Gemmataceae bacterium]